MEIRSNMTKYRKTSPSGYSQPKGPRRVVGQTEMLLYALGLSANYVGFQQLVVALEVAEQWPESLCMVTKWLYPEVARRCRTSWSAVERNIRQMLRLAWERARPELERLAGRTFAEKPAPAQFLSILLYILHRAV